MSYTKNTTQCPQPGLEPRPLTLESSSSTMRPLYFNVFIIFFPRLSQLASFAHTLQSTELASVGLPDFPIHNLVNIVRIMVSNVSLLLWHLISLNLKFWLIHYRYFLIKHLCVCCSSIFTFGTIFSEPVQNFLNRYKIF